jgi:hypothetical protein
MSSVFGQFVNFLVDAVGIQRNGAWRIADSMSDFGIGAGIGHPDCRSAATWNCTLFRPNGTVLCSTLGRGYYRLHNLFRRGFADSIFLPVQELNGSWHKAKARNSLR